MLNTNLFTLKIYKKIDSAALVSWLFLLGSLLFMLDAGLEIFENISVHSTIHISASLLFTVGSIFFLPRNQR
jgi:hypothetical protein